MLKIRDDVELEKLEVFGFNRNLKGQYETRDFTICKNRTIQVHNGGNYNRNDKLYDLIIAGLVEKVGD